VLEGITVAAVTATRDALHLELSRGEKWAALRRTDLVVPWDQVRSVESVAEPLRLVHGLRAPGLSIPWRRKIGSWRSKGQKTFAVTRKGQSGLRIMLRDNDYDELLLSVGHSGVLAEQISARLGESP